jgi:hypothetical protein
MSGNLLKHYFNIDLNREQETAFLQMASFIENKDFHIFQLIGYAGTGQTTLVSGYLI